MLFLKRGIGNWWIQVDLDEIFIDFSAFITDLRKCDSYLDSPHKHPIQIAGFSIIVYKYLDDGLLYVDEPTKVQLATNYPNYKVARKTDERVIYTRHALLHGCLSRSEEELHFKLDNWSHNVDINEGFLEKWKRVNKNNYKTIRDVYYMEPERWKKFGFFWIKGFGRD